MESNFVKIQLEKNEAYAVIDMAYNNINVYSLDEEGKSYKTREIEYTVHKIYKIKMYNSPFFILL